MNREMRRRYNKKNKTHYTKEEFDVMMAVERLKSGNYNFSDLKLPQDFIHMDNIEYAPNGTEVKLNFDSLNFRCSHVDKTNAFFREWVEQASENKDKIYHITREKARNSLVCLEEDKRTIELDGEIKECPPWLFDVYADLLFEDKKDGVWKTLGEIETLTGDTYVEVKNPREALKKETELEEKMEEKEN